VINSTRNLSKTDHRSTRSQTHRLALNLGAAFFLSIAAAVPAGASSHMDAPLITVDPAANTTDVYAFVTQNAFGQKFLSTALAVYPFEQPGIGPNTFRFDDRVAYDIHVSLDNNNIGQGKIDLTYRFRFKTVFPNDKTILTFLGQWGSYLWPVLMVSHPEIRPLPLQLAVFQASTRPEWGSVMAFGVIFVLPVLIMFMPSRPGTSQSM